MSTVLGLTFYWGRDHSLQDQQWWNCFSGFYVAYVLVPLFASSEVLIDLWIQSYVMQQACQFFPLPHGLGSVWPRIVCRSALCTPWSTLTWGGPRMPHFLSCLHRPSENELENSELSLLWVWGFVLFLCILMPFSSFLCKELVSVHFTRVWGNSWPESDRCEGSLMCQMCCSKPLCHPFNPFCVLFC